MELHDAGSAPLMPRIFRGMFILLVGLFAVMMFLNIWQVFRYRQLVNTIGQLEQEQQAILEQNKQLIVAISILRSPSRIGKLASEELGLTMIDPNRIIHVEFNGRGGGASYDE